MTLRRRPQFQKSLPTVTIYRTIEITCKNENQGLVTPSVNSTPVTLYDPAGAVVSGYVATISGSRIIANIPMPLTVGENYRLEFAWYESGQGPADLRIESIYFDVVAEEWTSDTTFDDLEQLVPSIRHRLTKQANLLSTTVTWQVMAARRLSDAQDHFFLWLRQKVRETNRPAWVALVPDRQRFDSIIAYLAVAFTFRGDISEANDDNDYRFKLWYARAQEEFSMMTLIEYDENQDLIPDDEVASPSRDAPLFEELRRD
jgi:hypothetical protein